MLTRARVLPRNGLKQLSFVGNTNNGTHRSLIIPTPTIKKTKRNRQRIRNVKIEDFDLDAIRNMEDPKELEYKLKQLREYTRRLYEDLKTSKKDVKEEFDYNSQVDVSKDAADIFHRLSQGSDATQINAHPGSEEDLSSLIRRTTLLEANQLLPPSISERIEDQDLIIRSLHNKSSQQWNPIIERLYQSGLIFEGISQKDMDMKFLRQIKGLTLENIERLDEMLLSNYQQDISKLSMTSYACLFENLGNLKPVSIQRPSTDPVISKFKALLKRIDESNLTREKPLKLNHHILNSCLNYTKKLKSINEINYFLTKFQNDYGIYPNKVNYTSIIQFYTQMNIPKKAWEIFATMKFLSKEHSPDIITYNKMLEVCLLEKDYSRALDLFHELTQAKITPTVTTLTKLIQIMAVCSGNSMTSDGKSESLRLLGWKYVPRIIESKRGEYMSKIFEVLGAMLSLAAYDGDVTLARALYFKYTTKKHQELRLKGGEGMSIQTLWKWALDPSILNHLLVVYSKFDAVKLPLLFNNTDGVKLRRNILNSVDYNGRSTDEINIPLLPVITLTTPEQVLAESKAIWSFCLEYGGTTNGLNDNIIREELITNGEWERLCKGPDSKELKSTLFSLISHWKTNLINTNVLNQKCLISYLTVPLRLGNKDEFLARFKLFTFQQKEFDDAISAVIDNQDNLITDDPIPDSSETNVVTSRKPADVDKHLDFLCSLRYKILATDPMYELEMKLATKLQDLELGIQVWKDRGIYRRTTHFNTLNKDERVRNDTEFAKLMIDFYVSQKMYIDAIGIIMASKRHIDWNYHMIKQLHQGLLQIEDKTNIKKLLEIVNKGSRIKLLEEEIDELTI
ncbi:Ccm1p NDAI_0H00550 [Naumovozyma dairenensis CBS 421]|uniref:Mitochondrial 15S rRNA processing factor CCM1 n=1 Tax=Naumovozyma dairenensis (strain ATCC 10597 / BCRC 20456 / CBS 421 / NBRC 0211 / NRRL Y-12639) TaxID=1071378 RepID=G0WEL8_NAUDC|nr:hypothetical protein NDAI_0H00550 [Naumovozyma dairenensis CBS 421]CCD26229.1 hypothetical protein NDAI_0H00550 [Naumovozyma dairenensis CBS 421]